MKTSICAVVACGVLGCSAPYKCEEGRLSSATYEPDNVEATAVMGAARLADDERAVVQLRATLRGLPRLWQEFSNIVDGSARYRFSVEYEDMPKGGDGKTEMPRIAGRLSMGGGRDEVETVSIPFQQGELTGQLGLFRTCRSADEPNCCVYGEETCSLLLDLQLKRLDATPFPPVVVSYAVEASAQVSPCPLESDVQATLTLEEEP